MFRSLLKALGVARTEKTHTVLAGRTERKKGTLLFKGKTESPEQRNTREGKKKILPSPLRTSGSRERKVKERGKERTVNKEKQESDVTGEETEM